eukprot:409380_1
MGSVVSRSCVYEPVAVESNTEDEIDMLDDNNNESSNDNIKQLTNCQLLTLIINTITIRPCARYILLFQSYLLAELDFTIIDIAYIESARNIGGIVSFVFPIIISKINTFRIFNGYISYRFVLSCLHTFAGLLILSYTLFGGFPHYFVTRFIFGIVIRLFSSYKNSMIATFTKKKDWIISYALIYLSYPLTIFYLIAFGFLLNYTS